MKKKIISILFLFSLIGCNTIEKKETRPNIIYILADDLGYGELDVYGQEKILTPNIDKLARSGMMFMQHYSGSPVCAPSRSVLLTGKHAGHTYIRGNDEWKERGEVWDYAKASADPNLEGQRPILKGTITIGSLLQKAGYKTGIFGKWGLGAPLSEGRPNLQGFDYFYGYNCQRQAHNLYPPHLWENDMKIILNNELIVPNTKLDKGADPYDEKSYSRFQQNDYAPEKIHQKALTFIKQNKDQPFFIYYASPLPHLPLQIPREYLDNYRKLFGEEQPYIGDKGYFPNRYPRAAYASIISYLDQQVGELVATLKELGLYKNTLIIFSSDNGPTYIGGVDFDFFNSAKPFKNGYGRSKGFVYEGGIRIPMITSWPNHIKAGSTTDHISAFYDLLPTICDITGIETPKDIDGISFKPTLLNQSQQKHDHLYWEFPSYKGQQAVRMNKWKGIRKNIFEKNMNIELYDLGKDIREENNVADQYPEVIKKIKRIMDEEHETSTIKRFQFNQLGDK